MGWNAGMAAIILATPLFGRDVANALTLGAGIDELPCVEAHICIRRRTLPPTNCASRRCPDPLPICVRNLLRWPGGGARGRLDVERSSWWRMSV
jgi:hypothetical protein